GRDEHLRRLYEWQLAQRRFFVQRAFFLAFPVEGEVRVHLLLPRAEGRRAHLEAFDEQYIVLSRFVAPVLLVPDHHRPRAPWDLARLRLDRNRAEQPDVVVASGEWLLIDVECLAARFHEREFIALAGFGRHRPPSASSLR